MDPQLSLFSSLPVTPPFNPDLVNRVNGLRYIENYVSQDEHDQILTSIDNELWLGDLKRRVQHYGYKYNYKSRSIDYDMYIGPLPPWAQSICAKLMNDQLINYLPDQIIVNEYLPGQGIANHIDCEPCFNDTIISLSLASTCIMDVIKKNEPNTKLELILAPRSLIVLSGEARYNWTHGIVGRKVDELDGIKIYRKRRVSLTFRKVILAGKDNLPEACKI